MIRTTALAIILAFTAPFAVQAETLKTEEYNSYQVSCEATTCGNFDVNFEESDEKVAQTRRTRTRTRTRRTRNTGNRLFKDFYVGGGAGIFFGGDGFDTGFQGNIFGGTKYNQYIGADLEFTFGFVDTDFDDNATILGFYLNPRFEYKFNNSSITAFISPGIGFSGFSGIDGIDGDTDFDFQIKAGASYPIKEKLDVFAQGRYQDNFESFSIEGGVIYDIMR